MMLAVLAIAAAVLVVAPVVLRNRTAEARVPVRVRDADRRRR